jgi:hypothetical protein
MGELTRTDESLALRTTLLCGLVVVLEGYDPSALGYVVASCWDLDGRLERCCWRCAARR